MHWPGGGPTSIVMTWWSDRRVRPAGPRAVLLRAWLRPQPEYDLVWDNRRYPHKAILGTAYELATGQRLGSGDFEGGKSGAVAVLRTLGFTIQDKD